MKAKRIPKAVREQKLAQCPFCAVCGKTEDLELNHFDPAGDATFDNLIVLCSRHHMLWHSVQAENRHADLVRKGIQEAKANGVKFGRKAADYERVIRLIAENSTQFNPMSWHTEAEIMAMAGVKATVYYRCKRMLVAAMNSDSWPYAWIKPKMVRRHPKYPERRS